MLSQVPKVKSPEHRITTCKSLKETDSYFVTKNYLETVYIFFSFEFSTFTLNSTSLFSAHHRINNLEVTPPKTSPASAPQVPVFSPSSPSSPSFDPSSSTYLSSTSSSPELRLVLLGRSGAGKSAAGNAILGREEFVSYPESLTAITQECEKQKTVVEGKRVCSTDVLCYFKNIRVLCIYACAKCNAPKEKY